MSTIAARVIELPSVAVTITEYGSAEAGKGTGVLVLHGGAGTNSVSGLAAALSEHAYVIAPIHPGFDGTPRPDGFDQIADIASAYLDLLDRLDLNAVMVFGSSVGGWIAAEMALRDNHGRIGCVVLANAAGIKPEPGQEIADVSVLSPAEIGRLAFHDPRFRQDPASLTDQQRATSIANLRTLATYTGPAGMYDPKLRSRLHRVEVPVLVLWGEQDGIIPLEYGRTFARAFPRARFVPIPDAAHFPFIENPGATAGAMGDFIDTEVKP
jgi:pimeloyl-ACP methyl ester carboxylesterase